MTALVFLVPGSEVGQLMAHDADEEGTLNSQLTYAIETQIPLTTPLSFSIDASTGKIQALRSLRRKEEQLYNLLVKVSDSGNTHTQTHTNTHTAR